MPASKSTEEMVSQVKQWQDSDLFLALVKSAVDGIIAIDERGHIILVNPAAERLFGYPREEVIGQNVGLFMPDPYHSEHDKYLQNYLATGKRHIIGVGREVTGQRKDGGTFPMHLSVAEGWRSGQRFFVSIVHDLTETKQREAAIRRLAVLVEASEDAIIGETLEGVITDWNTAAEKMYGYTAEEICGQLIAVLVPPERADEISQIIQHIRQGKSITQFETVRVCKNGRRISVSLSISPIKDSQGRITGAARIARDITRRKQKEEELLWLSRALEQSPVAVMITDTRGDIQYINARFTTLTGYHREEIIGKNPRILQSGETSQEEYQQLWRTITSGGEWRGEIRDRRKGGGLYWVREHISPIRNLEGKITHFLSAAEDITDRKQMEQALRESEERFRQVARMTGEWIWEQDSSGCYLYCSGAVKEILGYEPEEMLGKHYGEFLTPEAHEKGTYKSQGTLNGGQRFFHLVNYYRHKEGCQVFTESSGEPVFDEQGRLIKWLGVDRDISKRLESQKVIRQTQVRLAVARNELKIARKIQRSLLPSDPLILPGVEVTGYCLPASQVGGDYFDYYHRPDHRVDVAIADVSGHSVGPALFMVEIRSALKTQIRSQRTAASILAVLNDSLYEDLSRADHFITMFYLQYYMSTGEINYASAGHNPPLLLRSGGTTCIKLDADGMIFGVKKEVLFEEGRISLEKGDIIFLYTDGIIEAENKEGEFFGTERLCEILMAHTHFSPQELIKMIVEKLQDFCESKTFRDDVTMIALKVM